MKPCALDAISGPTLLAQTRQPVTIVGRPSVQTSEGHPFLVPSLAGALAAVMIGAIVVRAWRRRTGAPGRRALTLLARSAGLSATERALIERIGAPEPAALLVSEHAFAVAAERWGKSGPSESDRQAIGAIAARLGWNVPEFQPEKVTAQEPRRVTRAAAMSRTVPVRKARLVA